MTTLPNGQIIPAQVPAHTEQHVQNMTGSAVDAASQKNLASVAAQAAQVKHLGAGQKGGSNVVPFNLPEANSIKGISHAGIHEAAGNLHAQLKANAAGDSLANANPIQLGGMQKFSDGVYRMKMSKTKRNGRSHKRSNRRKRRRTTRRRRRNHHK